MFLRYSSVLLFPKLTPEGYRIFCTKTNPTTDEDAFDFLLFCQVSIATLDLQLKDEPMYGNISLYDLKHVQLSQFLAFTPTMTKKLLKIGMVSDYTFTYICWVSPNRDHLMWFFAQFFKTLKFCSLHSYF